MITKAEIEQCRKCEYRMQHKGFLACNYLDITGQRRPSPTGVPCKEFKEGKQIKVHIDIFTGETIRSDNESI